MDYTGLIASIPGYIQAGTGIAQSVKGNRMLRDLQDPTMPIPQSAIDALNLARTRAGVSALPGEEAYLNDIGQIMAGAENSINRSATSAPQALGGTLNALGQQFRALNNLQGMRAQNINQNQRDLIDALNVMAGYEKNKWANDVFNPFQRKATAASALTGAGMQNIFAGASDISGVYANRMRDKENREFWKSVLGKSKETPSVGLIPAAQSEYGSTTVDPSVISDQTKWLDEMFNRLTRDYNEP